MLKIPIAACHDLSPVISTQFTLEMCVAATKREKKSLKTAIIRFKVVQGHRCWYPGKLVGSACYDTQQVCVYLQPFSC